jgi:hypothetical protein
MLKFLMQKRPYGVQKATICNRESATIFGMQKTGNSWLMSCVALLLLAALSLASQTTFAQEATPALPDDPAAFLVHAGQATLLSQSGRTSLASEGVHRALR